MGALELAELLEQVGVVAAHGVRVALGLAVLLLGQRGLRHERPQTGFVGLLGEVGELLLGDGDVALDRLAAVGHVSQTPFDQGAAHERSLRSTAADSRHPSWPARRAPRHWHDGPMAPTPPAATVDRTAVLRHRWARHQLHREAGSASVADLDVDLLDLGVQDTGPDGSAWALALRGLDARAGGDALALAWTLRGAPHAYRRRDLAAVAVATAPWSEADAAKRIFDASKPLAAAGISVLDALRTVADHLRTLTAEPIAKGDASGALNGLLPDPFLRDCRPCKARHIYELPFRLAALQAGIELEAGTSPPVLRRVPGLVPNDYRHLADEADPAFDVLRGVLRAWGPTTPKEAATFLDAPLKEVRARWPEGAVEVAVAGTPEPRVASVLADDLDELRDGSGLDASGTLRLLGPYDPYLQGRDRDVLVPDAARRAALWPVLGRPGAVAVDGEIVGLWRPNTTKGRLAVRVEPWADLGPLEAALEAEAARLAAHREVAFAGTEPMAAT